MPGTLDVLLVSIGGTTAGGAPPAGSCGFAAAGARAHAVDHRPARRVRTFALTDLVQARGAQARRPPGDRRAATRARSSTAR